MLPGHPLFLPLFLLAYFACVCFDIFDWASGDKGSSQDGLEVWEKQLFRLNALNQCDGLLSWVPIKVKQCDLPGEMLTSAVTLVPFWILPRSLRPTRQWFERDFIRLSLILISIFFLGIWYLSYTRASATYLANILPGPPLNVLLPLSVAPNPKSEVKGLEAQLTC